MSNKQKNALIGAGLILVLTAGVGTYHFLQMPDTKVPTINNQLENIQSSLLFAVSENGIITLYNSEDGKLIDKFDLKTLSAGKEIKVEVVKPQVKTPVQEPMETYKDFLQVPITIKKGDTVWDIQEGLTPKQNTSVMLKYLREINKGKLLHPVYPGDERVFLKDKNGEVLSEPKKEEVVEQNTEPTMKKVDGEAVYIYSKSTDFKTLYAYNEIEKTFYSMSENNKKIVAETLFTIPEIKDVTTFEIVDSKLYVITENGAKLREISLSDNKSKEYLLKGTPDLFAVRDGFVFYTYEDKLSKINLNNGEEESILMGDKSSDFIFTADKLFILNEFGSKLDNSILIKINPSDLKVDDIVELKSKQNAILSEVQDTKSILVGQIIKTVDVDKSVKETPVILPIKVNNLQKDLFIKNVPFNKNALEMDGLIYEVEDGKISIFSATNGSLTKEVKVENVSQIMPLR